MNRFKYILVLLVSAVMFASCDKLEEDKPVFDGPAQAEIDASVLNTVTTGRTYPILTRVAGYGRPVIASIDPLISRTSGTIRFRVNLVTAQRSNAETLSYKVVDTEVINGTSTTVTTAQAGVHYNASGTLTIPANSSFGEIEIQVLNPGPSSGTRDLVLELVGNSNIQPSANYKKIGIRIAQN